MNVRAWPMLLVKESLALVPHWLGMITLIAIFGVLQLYGGSLTLDPVSGRVTGGAEGVLLVFLLSFAAGHAAVGTEFFSRHIEMLDALPVRRWEIFAAKLIASVAPGVFTVLHSLSWDLVSTWLSPGAPGASPYTEVVLVHALLLVGSLAGWGLGLLASWLGPLGWGIVVLWLVVTGIFSVLTPGLRPYAIGFGSFGELVFVDREPTHALGPVVLWTAVGLLSALFSGLLFLGPGGRLTQRGSLATGTVRVGAIGCLSVLLFGFGGLGALILAFEAPGLLEPMAVETTEQFRILYRPAYEAQVQASTEGVDALSAELGAQMGQTEPLHLDLEFLGAQDNHGGVFTGGKVRLQPGADRHVLAHELSHAHAFRMTGSGGWHQADHTRFFQEGLAEWVANEVVGEPGIPPRAAAIHALDPVEFDLLVEDERWVHERDIAQPYPLGEAFVEALDAEGGAETRACVLRELGTFGRQPIAGLALWVTVADRCGFVLDDVVARFERLLEEAAADLPELPEVEASLQGDRLRVVDRNATGLPLICRFRGFADAEVSSYIHMDVDDGTCSLPPKWMLPEKTFGYQVGFRFDGDAVFDRWVVAPTPR